MLSSTFTTARQIWSKLTNKEYRDSFVASNIANTVSSQVFTLRDQRGWTQKELAQRAGMGQSRIPALEDPNLDNFEIGTLKRLASAFDVALVVRFVPFSELVDWTTNLSEEKLLVSEFASDTLMPASTNFSSAQIINIDTRTNMAMGVGYYGGNAGIANSSASISASTQTIAVGVAMYPHMHGANLNGTIPNIFVMPSHKDAHV